MREAARQRRQIVVFCRRVSESDYDDTDLQKPAYEAEERFERYRTISIVTGVTAVAAGVVTWWLWPESNTRVAPSVSGDGNYSTSLEVAW